MDDLITWLASSGEPPARLPSPFDESPPHPLARAAAEGLLARLRSGAIAVELQGRREGGKMFGVLVVRAADGRVGVLQAFSGQLGWAWRVPGFVPPLFDEAARARVEVASDEALHAMTARVEALRAAPALRQAREALAAFDEGLRVRRVEQKQWLAGRKRDRQVRRAGLAGAEPLGADGRSVGAAPLRARVEGDATPRAEGEVPLTGMFAGEGEAARRAGDEGAREASGVEGGGAPRRAGDDGARDAPGVEGSEAARCAGAEAPGTGAEAALAAESREDTLTQRRQEAAWRAERAQLVAVLAARLEELTSLEAARAETSRAAMKAIFDTYRLRNARAEETSLRSLFERGEPPWGAADCAAPKLLGFAVANGLTPLALAEFWWGPPPPGGGRAEGHFFPACREKCAPILPFLLAGVPVAARLETSGEGRVLTLHADAQVRVVVKPAGRTSSPEEGHLVARLDLDASGLAVAALDAATLAALERQCCAGEVPVRYIAWLEGEVLGERGTSAGLGEFRWRVLERRDGQTRVALRPRGGHPHRLAASVVQALGLPIASEGPLLLHAEWLRFRHPVTGALLEFTSPAPF